jgi:hypothetical protein
MAKMRMLALFGAKTLVASLGSAALAGWLAWLILPISPRSVVKDEETTSIICCSNDCRYVALSKYSVPGGIVVKLVGIDLKIWDTRERRLLFSKPSSMDFGSLDPVCAAAFTPNGDKLVTFVMGQANVYAVPSGEPIAHEIQYAEIGGWSQLVTDPHEELFVVSRIETNTVSVREFWTGKEVGRWDRSGRIWNVCPGGVMVWSDNGEPLFREIPGGMKHPTLRPEVFFLRPAGSFLATPDCRTVVQIGPTAELDRNGAPVPIDPTIRVLKEGQPRDLDIAAQLYPAISPDGRLFAGSFHDLSPATLLTPWLEKLNIRRADSHCVVYDLTTGAEVARFPFGVNAHFSRDGKTLVVGTDESLEFYDLPLRRPWGWIAGIACCGAMVVFASGQWFRWRKRKPIESRKPV